MSNLEAKEYKPFETIKHFSDDGSEFWNARELAVVLNYVQWRNFGKVLQRAIIACKNSGYEVVDHFAEVSKIVEAGATSKPIVDYKLTRYACYLIVQNAGYMGLYGGMKVDDIHQKKGLKKTEKILDFMSSTELIANLFRISQTEDKLKKDNISNSSDANETHFIVGREVRGTIERVGGTMPEDLPVPKKSISKIEQEQLKRLKNNNKLMLDE